MWIIASSVALSALVTSAGAFTPTFSGSVFSYYIAVPYTTSSVTITATLLDTTDSLTIDGDEAGDGVIW